MTNDELRVQPHDRLAEEIVLGAMMSSGHAAAEALKRLRGSDFYVPNHGTIFETIAALYEARQPTDLGAVHSKLLTNGTLNRVGGGVFLFECCEKAATGTSQVAYFADQIAELAKRRDLITFGTQVVQRGFAADGQSSDELETWAAERLASIRAGSGEAGVEDHLSTGELLDEPPPHRWVLPNLLERGDRLMLTGGEGAGKSMLTRQIAVCAAAGLHPFTHRPCEPMRTLVVDCENSRTMTMRRYRPLLLAAADLGHPVGANFTLYLESAGIDLTNRGGAGWLLRRVEKFKPDLIAIGPLYRLHFGDPNDERDARRVAAALDRAREVSGAALVIEAHAPHKAPGVRQRALRPVGSSLWMRWPEFGFGIAPDDDPMNERWRVSKLQSWRGARDERLWPRQIRMGNPWPWVSDDEPAVYGWT